jgi:hypothetical protein
MNVKELRKKKLELENEIAVSVHTKLEEFHAETGFSPNGVFIRLVDVTEMGQEEPYFVVAGCEANIDL